MFRSGVKRDKLDILVSDLVRSANSWICEKCGRDCRYMPSFLHCSHVASRAIRRLRYDFRNLAALCSSCHYYMEARPIAHAAWFGEHRPRDYAFVLREQHLPVKFRVGEQEQIYHFYLFQKRMLDELVKKDYNTKFKLTPWNWDLYK